MTRPRKSDEGRPRRSDGGFTLIEITVAFTFLVTGLLGFVGAIVSSQILAKATREMNIANAAVINAVEDFRDSCMTDFTQTLTRFKGGATLKPSVPPELGEGAAMTGTVILDETKVSPVMDLDGSGVAGDNKAVLASAANAAVFRVDLTWSGVLGPQTIEYTTVLAKGELQ